VVSDLRKAPPGTDARTLLPKVAGASAGMKNVSQWFDTVHGTIDGRINRESTVPPGAPVVLVADDDEFQAKLMGRILEHAGYQAIFACNGNEAIKQAGASHPDAILLDYAMPDLNGLQVLEQMAHIPGMPKIPVIMVTGNSQRDVILGSRKLGAVEYLVKPFESKALLTKLARALTHV
jgi:CheY-like chemotaxis protein